MNIIDIANEIQKKIAEIDNIRKEIKQRGEAKAEATMNYEKQIAITLIKLENGESFNLDDEIIQNPPKSVMEKLSRGICYQQKYNLELAEISYKSLLVNLEAVQSQLNALQSLFRHLDKA